MITTSVETTVFTAALRRAAVRATLAPSVHNTQPWRFELDPNELRLIADPSRQLRVLDPTRRQLTISCGCALFNARASLAAAGHTTAIERFPDPVNDDVLARVAVSGVPHSPIEDVGYLDDVVELRRTNRRPFSIDPVPSDVLETLERAARSEGSLLVAVRSENHRLALSRLSQLADATQSLDPAYRSELRAWTTGEAARRDGVPSAAVPHLTAAGRGDVPIRDFDPYGIGELAVEAASSRTQCLLLLCTRGDNPTDWLRAGEALERVLLEVARAGFAASPLTQVVEVPSTRAALRSELGLSSYPHVLLRVGRAPRTPATRRRRLVDMLDETTSSRV